MFEKARQVVRGCMKNTGSECKRPALPSREVDDGATQRPSLCACTMPCIKHEQLSLEWTCPKEAENLLPLSLFTCSPSKGSAQENRSVLSSSDDDGGGVAKS